ncbi:hypothetical protein Poly30_10520 [Planctomycetes bacterium Poly30]|uniref:Uncharacterized protein n=1 Tax=Saltatorellus ferox TaxID=2528018 RepID=A0A518EN98_9BACT|nr:hypothetical protein Poly30_10520 [Planctomycetes bacterium Poly30]
MRKPTKGKKMQVKEERSKLTDAPVSRGCPVGVGQVVPFVGTGPWLLDTAEFGAFTRTDARRMRVHEDHTAHRSRETI